MASEFRRKRLIVLILSCIVMLFLGLMYAWSVFVAPLEEEFGWLRIQTSLTFTITMSCFSLGNFLASFIMSRRGIKTSLAVSAGLVLLGIGGASRIHSLGGFYLTYGVCCGLGIGSAYNGIINTASRWFPDRQGFATGLVLMGFGTGGMLLGMAASAAIQVWGWRSTFLGISLLFFFTLLLAAALMDMPAADTQFPAARNGSTRISPVDIPPREMLHLGSFYFYLAWTVMVISGGLMVIGNAAPMAVELGANTGTSVLLAGVLSICNSLGRFVFGIYYDRRGLRSCLLVTTGVFALSGIALIQSYHAGSLVWLFSGFVMMGLACGSVPSVSPIFMQEFYGARFLSANLALASFNTLITSMIGTPIAGAIQTQYGSYRFAMWLLPLFALLALLCVPGIRKTS